MDDQTPHIESDILFRLVNDDMDAFDELYWKYQTAVYQNVFKLTKDADATADIVQEVFISLWEKRSSIDCNRPVGGWLFVSSYNRSLNVLKKKLKESLLYKSLQLPEEALPGEEDIDSIRLEILEKAVESLSPQKRKVFELCKMEGKTYEEAAGIMHISKHTVKEYLSAAVLSIKEYVSQHSAQSIGLIFLLHLLK